MFKKGLFLEQSKKLNKLKRYLLTQIRDYIMCNTTINCKRYNKLKKSFFLLYNF